MLEESFSVWRDWLPEEVAKDARSREPNLLGAWTDSVEVQWNLLEGEITRSVEIAKWTGVLTDVLGAYGNKAEVPSKDVEKAALLLLDIIIGSDSNRDAQAKWIKLLQKLLHKHRRRIQLAIPWRPLFKLIHAETFGPLQPYRGRNEKGNEDLRKLIHTCRRFFPLGTAQEIWQEFGPSLHSTYKQEGFESLCWLVIFMPTQAAKQGDGAWSSWVPEWLDLWDSVVHNKYWSCLWMVLFARLVRHDALGLVDWTPLVPRLFTHIMWAFPVPVGTATAEPPISRGDSARFDLLFHGLFTTRSVTSVYIVINLLGRRTEPAQNDCVLQHLVKTVNLLEQYFHPSNTGRWASNLSSFLQTMQKQLIKRLFREKAPKRPDEYGNPAPTVPQLLPETCRCVSELIVKLASRAQYSKDHELSNAACNALSALAYVEPDLILPLVHERFQVALDSVTAAHQLATAIETLAACVRPMLLAGMAVTDPDALAMETSGASLSDQAHLASAAEAVAGALMATLPGIDANDPPKTLACFRFYCVVLSTVGELKDTPWPGLPLYTEEWVEELLSRIFAILTNLDAPEERGGHHTLREDPDGSFLVDGNSMFRPMVELLLSRLPAALRRHAVRLIARFVTSTHLSSVVAETTILCHAALIADTEATIELLFVPLLGKTEAELTSLARSDAKSSTPSRIQEGLLASQLELLGSCIYAMGTFLLPLRQRIAKLLKSAFLVRSKAVKQAAAVVLCHIFTSLASYYPMATFEAADAVSVLGVAGFEREVWVDRFASGISKKPRWHIPDAEEVAYAEQLVEEYLCVPSQLLLALCGGDRSSMPADATAGSIAEKEYIRGLLQQIDGVVSGLKTSLPDFSHAQPSGGVSLVMAGASGAQVGLTSDRELAARALAAVINYGGAQDPDTLSFIISVMSSVMGRGREELETANQYNGTFVEDEKSEKQPSIANLMAPNPGSVHWKGRWPFWLVMERVYGCEMMFRASQAAQNWFCTTSHPQATLEMLHPLFMALVERLLRLSFSPYHEVRVDAVSELERICSQYPAIVPTCIPYALTALAGLSLEGGVFNDTALSPGGITPELVASLRAAMKGVRPAGSAIAGASLSETDVAKEIGLVAGAINVLKCKTMWARIGQDCTSFASFLMALMASSCITSQQASDNIFYISFIFGVSFSRPPEMLIAQVENKPLPAIIYTLMEDLMLLAAPGASTLHWKYSLMAHSFLLRALPCSDPKLSELLARHWLGLVRSELSSERNLGLIGLVHHFPDTILQCRGLPWQTDVVVAAATQAVDDWLSSTPDFVPKLLEQLGHAHPADPVGQAEEPRGRRSLGGGSHSDMLIQHYGNVLDHYYIWPISQGQLPALANHSFVILHARLAGVLAAAAPFSAMAAFQAPLEAALMDKQLDADRPATFAAVESLFGLIASGVVFEGGEGASAWSSWVKPLLTSSILAAPLDMSPAWTVGIRLAVHALALRAHPGLVSLLAVIIEPLPKGCPSSLVVKRLSNLSNCLAELSGIDVPCGAIASGVDAFQMRTLQELPELMALVGEPVRAHSAQCAAIACSSVLARPERVLDSRVGVTSAAPVISDDGALRLLSTSGGNLRDAALGFCNYAVKTLEEAVTAVVVANYPSTQAGAGGLDLLPKAADETMEMVGDEVAVVAGHTENVLEEMDIAEGQGVGGSTYDTRVAQLGFGIQFVAQALSSRLGAVLTPTLLRMLPSLLKSQELASPNLQQLALEAKSAAALLKYLPLPVAELPGVVACVSSFKDAEAWFSRGAALVYAQYFWFRHTFLLSTDDESRLLDFVGAMLADRKLEVQELAAGTLSGMLKGLPEDRVTALRQRFLAEVAASASAGRMARRKNSRAGSVASAPSAAGAGALVSVAERHAGVLGLKAFVLSSPYDVPAWLPEVLMGLVGAASEPPPLRTTVRKTLGEFRRTHEDAGLQEARRLLTPDQWNSIQDVASPASYFV